MYFILGVHQTSVFIVSSLAFVLGVDLAPTTTRRVRGAGQLRRVCEQALIGQLMHIVVGVI